MWRRFHLLNSFLTLVFHKVVWWRVWGAVRWSLYFKFSADWWSIGGLLANIWLSYAKNTVDSIFRIRCKTRTTHTSEGQSCTVHGVNMKSNGLIPRKKNYKYYEDGNRWRESSRTHLTYICDKLMWMIQRHLCLPPAPLIKRYVMTLPDITPNP